MTFLLRLVCIGLARWYRYWSTVPHTPELRREYAAKARAFKARADALRDGTSRL